MAIRPLPPPAPKQSYCDVSALEGGIIEMQCDMVVTSAKKDEKVVVPALAFLLTHSTTKQRLLFDLGMGRDMSRLPPKMRLLIEPIAAVPQDVPESLALGGLTPEDITHICLSHMHCDHYGDPSRFKNARFLVGAGSRGVLQPGYPADPDALFPTVLLPEDRTEDLDPAGWAPVGPFPRALDLYGDGSLYIVDAPGHLPGHINILARTSSNGGWLYLAADSAHDWRLIKGEGEIAVQRDEHGHEQCLHVNKEESLETIRRIADFLTLPRTRVIIAHDSGWYAENKGGDAFWPGIIASV